MKHTFRRHSELIILLAMIVLTAGMIYGANQWWNATYIHEEGSQ